MSEPYVPGIGGTRIKPAGATFAIREQIIDERQGVSGLCLWIRKSGDDGNFYVTVISDLIPMGNRDFYFNAVGELAGGGCGTCAPEPSWLTAVE